MKPAPAKAPPLAAEPKPVRVAKPIAPEAKFSRAALNQRPPAETRASVAGRPAAAKTITAKPSSGRYLVLHSFRESGRAKSLAEQYSHLDAKVASATLHGQTWYRVVVRDGTSQRSRLASDGVRGYWPVTL